MVIAPLAVERAPDAIAVLYDAFHDYPAMRFVLGPDADYDARLRTLIGLFVMARMARRAPVLGARDAAGALVGVATLTVPNEPPPPDSFADWREQLWRTLGEDARQRYRAFADGTAAFEPGEPNHHLNMIGVLRSHRGRGISRLLLEAVHEVAAAHPDSSGVSLTTEHAPNVALYEHFGYRRLGHARIAPGFESWVMFRPRGTASS